MLHFSLASASSSNYARTSAGLLGQSSSAVWSFLRSFTRYLTSQMGRLSLLDTFSQLVSPELREFQRDLDFTSIVNPQRRSVRRGLRMPGSLSATLRPIPASYSFSGLAAVDRYQLCPVEIRPADPLLGPFLLVHLFQRLHMAAVQQGQSRTDPILKSK